MAVKKGIKKALCKSLLFWPAVLLFFIATKTPAQNIIPRFETLGVNEGLSQSSVYNIYQDKAGFMWFGTADGLNRYDGQFIKIFKVKENITANSNYVRGTITEDKAGNIWYTNETGVFCLDVVKEQLTRRYTLDQRDQASGVFIDKQNIFWILCTDGVAAFDINKTTWRQFKYTFSLNSKNATGFRVTTDKVNNIWFKNNGFGIYHFNTQSHSYQHTLKNAPVSCLSYSKNYIYYWCNDQLITADTALNTIKKKHFDIKDKAMMVIDILPDIYNRIWLTTSNSGMLCYNMQTGKMDSYMHDNSRQKSLSFDITRCLYIDSFDNLWVGTDGGGVSRLDLKPAKFNLFPLNEGDYTFLNNYFIKCLYEDDKGRIWFGTQNNGLNVFDPASRTVKNYSSNGKGPLSGIVSAIFKDRDGNMWIGCSTGVAIFDQQKEMFASVDISTVPIQYLYKASNFITRFRQLHDGSLLLASSLGLYSIVKNKGGYSTAGIINEKLQGLCTDVVEAADNSLFVAVPGTGVYQLKKHNGSYQIKRRLFAGMDLRGLHVDEFNKDKLWIGSAIGLIEFNIGSGKYKIYDKAQGLANEFVYGVLQDSNQNIWISTNGGLSFFDRDKTIFQNYTTNDGLQSNEFNTGAYYKSDKATLYFGGIKGFNWFNPGALYSGRLKPGVAITTVLVDDKPYLKKTTLVRSGEINIPYDNNSLSISFAALDYTMPSANKIAYMLVGQDNKWIITNNKNVRYARLTPGHYLFKVKALNGDGVWSNIKTLGISIKAPFWQRTWFFIVTGICLAGAIIYITYTLSQAKIKRRLRQLEKQHAVDAERNRISRDMHDEIGSGLTHIALLSELIQTQHKTDAAVKSDVGNISASARKLITNMSEIIWALNPQNDSLENLLAYTREQMQQFFQPFDTVLEIDFPDVLPCISLTNEQRRNLYLVTKEALNNAMKHARATNIKLSFAQQQNKMMFTVQDNGCGLPDGDFRLNCNGLKNMQKRMDDIAGYINWSNGPQGLTVSYFIHC